MDISKKTNDQVSEDVISVGSFLAWQEPREMMGGVRAEEAFSAFCRLMHFPEDHFRKIFRPDDE